MNVRFLSPIVQPVKQQAITLISFCIIRAPTSFSIQTKLQIAKYTQKLMRFALEYYTRVAAKNFKEKEDKESKDGFFSLPARKSKSTLEDKENEDGAVTLSIPTLLRSFSVSKLGRRVEKLENGLEEVGLYALSLSGVLFFFFLVFIFLIFVCGVCVNAVCY
jgi:hypothetical protein